VTGVLFLRPAEIVADLENLPIYEVLIALCVLASAPGPDPAARRPVAGRPAPASSACSA